jgi:hypothetical protein
MMSDEKSEPKAPNGDLRLASPLERLSKGLCQGLRNPPRQGESIFTLAMTVDENEKDAFLTIHSPTHVSLSDATVRGGTDFGMFDCQTCTLYVDFGGREALVAGIPIKVKVRKQAKKCDDVYPTIVIR